jgi:hypothetical protein
VLVWLVENISRREKVCSAKKTNVKFFHEVFLCVADSHPMSKFPHVFEVKGLRYQQNLSFFAYYLLQILIIFNNLQT